MQRTIHTDDAAVAAAALVAELEEERGLSAAHAPSEGERQRVK